MGVGERRRIGGRHGCDQILDLCRLFAERIELPLGGIAADLDDLGDRGLGVLACGKLRLGQLGVEDVGRSLHRVERGNDCGVAGGNLLRFLDIAEHLFAVREDVLIGALAAEQQVATLVHGLFEHGFERPV